jgi:hypothetical protein
MRLECIKSIVSVNVNNTQEEIVCLQGDIIVFNGNNKDEILIFEGVEGWCEGIKLHLTPKIVAEHFKFKTNRGPIFI